MVSRRSFLKAGLLGTITLAIAGGIYRSVQTTDTPERFTLDDSAKSALAAIIPVILKGAVDSQSPAVTEAIARVEGAISGLPLTTQKEVQDLFGLLTLGPTRRFLVGLPDDWPEAKPEDVATFLQSWRTHRFPLMQSAYHALHDLIAGPWYADESTWAAIGYPGPMKELS